MGVLCFLRTKLVIKYLCSLAPRVSEVDTDTFTGNFRGKLKRNTCNQRPGYYSAILKRGSFQSLLKVRQKHHQMEFHTMKFDYFTSEWNIHALKGTEKREVFPSLKYEYSYSFSTLSLYSREAFFSLTHTYNWCTLE